MFTTDTPWGKAQSYENLGQGLFVCSTATHGGYYVPECMRHAIPADQQAWAAQWAPEGWYEEDCCWAAVALAFPHLFPADALPVARAILAGCLAA